MSYLLIAPTAAPNSRTLNDCVSDFLSRVEQGRQFNPAVHDGGR